MTGRTEVSAVFVPRSVAALEVAAAVTGDNDDDVINRSVQVYAYLTKTMSEGKVVLVVDPSTGARERLVLL